MIRMVVPIPDFATLINEVTDQVRPLEEDVTDRRILDATCSVIGDIGERRVTIDDVAEVSRVSRATVFRRFGSRDTLLQRLYQREVRTTVQIVVTAAAEASDPVSALIDAYDRLLRHAAEHPVVKRLADAEPDILVGLWRESEPSGAMLVSTLIAQPVLDREDAGDLDGAAVRSLADMLARHLFAELLLPADPPGWIDSSRARAVRLLVESWLHAPAGA